MVLTWIARAPAQIHTRASPSMNDGQQKRVRGKACWALKVEAGVARPYTAGALLLGENAAGAGAMHPSELVCGARAFGRLQAVQGAVGLVGE
jgi:hypothetical protein